MLKEDLPPVFADLLPNDDDWKSTFVDLEYRVGLVQEATQGRSGGYGAAPGEAVDQSGRSPWSEFCGGVAELKQALISYREVLRELYRYRR